MLISNRSVDSLKPSSPLFSNHLYFVLDSCRMSILVQLQNVKIPGMPALEGIFLLPGKLSTPSIVHYIKNMNTLLLKQKITEKYKLHLM